jgi:hypothetical protein
MRERSIEIAIGTGDHGGEWDSGGEEIGFKQRRWFWKVREGHAIVQEQDGTAISHATSGPQASEGLSIDQKIQMRSRVFTPGAQRKPVRY